MAYTAGNLHMTGSGMPGTCIYIYHTTDPLEDVDGAGYFNNKDDNLNLQKGDIVFVQEWATAVLTGTISRAGAYLVSNVIGNEVAHPNPGNVNLAAFLEVTTAAISSGG